MKIQKDKKPILIDTITINGIEFILKSKNDEIIASEVSDTVKSIQDITKTQIDDKKTTFKIANLVEITEHFNHTEFGNRTEDYLWLPDLVYTYFDNKENKISKEDLEELTNQEIYPINLILQVQDLISNVKDKDNSL